MPDGDWTDGDVELAAAKAGLSAFYAHDPEGLTRAFKAAQGYRERRVVVADTSVEPAHVYRLEQPADDAAEPRS